MMKDGGVRLVMNTTEGAQAVEDSRRGTGDGKPQRRGDRGPAVAGVRGSTQRLDPSRARAPDLRAAKVGVQPDGSPNFIQIAHPRPSHCIFIERNW